MALVIAASVLAISGRAGLTQPSGSSVEYQFDIQAQSLEAALEAFTAATHLQILYETALTNDRRSSEVTGAYTQEAALLKLLAGTGLDFGYTGDHAFTLVLARVHSPAAQTRGIASFNQYLGLVQNGVMAALCRRDETRPGAFGVAMQFWIGASGKVEKASLLNSTGAAFRDAVITDALMRAAFGTPPPASMPQPVTMVLRADAAGGDGECAMVRP